MRACISGFAPLRTLLIFIFRLCRDVERRAKQTVVDEPTSLRRREVQVARVAAQSVEERLETGRRQKNRSADGRTARVGPTGIEGFCRIRQGSSAARAETSSDQFA